MSNSGNIKSIGGGRVCQERIPLKPLSLDTRSLALIDGETAIEKLRARVAELRAIEGGAMSPHPKAIEALLNKAQSLMDGLRSTWLRRDLEGMADDAQAMHMVMEELTDALRKQP